MCYYEGTVAETQTQHCFIIWKLQDADGQNHVFFMISNMEEQNIPYPALSV